MARIRLVPPGDASGVVAQVYDEIIAHRGPAGVTNVWKAYAAFPALLRANWERLQTLNTYGTLSPRVKKAISYSVASANNCTR